MTTKRYVSPINVNTIHKIANLDFDEWSKVGLFKRQMRTAGSNIFRWKKLGMKHCC